MRKGWMVVGAIVAGALGAALCVLAGSNDAAAGCCGLAIGGVIVIFYID